MIEESDTESCNCGPCIQYDCPCVDEDVEGLCLCDECQCGNCKNI